MFSCTRSGVLVDGIRVGVGAGAGTLVALEVGSSVAVGEMEK